MEEKNLIQEGWRNLRHGATDLALGFFFVFCATSRRIAHAVSKSAHRHPFAYIMAEALIFAVIYFLSVGKARAQRDNSNLKAYRTEISKDSLQIIIDSYIPRYGK